MARKRRPQRTLVWGDGFVDTRQRKDGTTYFQARWPELNAQGHRILRAKSFNTLDEADDFLRQIGRDKRAGRYANHTTLTVEQLIGEYMDRAAGRWKSNTYSTYVVYRDRLVLPALGKQRVADLKPRQVQVWVDGLAGRNLSASAIANALTLLRSALKEAMLLGMIDRNPAQGVKVPRRSPDPRPTWTLAQARKVLDVVEDDPFLHALYAVAILTGMRPGEIRALQWSDVDLKRRWITCNRTITRDRDAKAVMGTSTKTGRSRIIVTSEFVVRALERWRKIQIERRLAHPAWIDDDIVFDRGDGGFLPQASLQVDHRRVVALAKVPAIRLHDIRHTYATVELEAGTHPRIVSERLGHATIRTTLDLYTHVSIDLQQAAADAFAQRLRDVEPDATTSGSESS